MNYGKGIFFNDALDILLPEIYPVAVDELELKVVSQPELDIKEVKDDGAIVLVANVDVRPEVKVENYKGVERSEEHTSELQSRQYLVCRLLLEKKKHIYTNLYIHL